MPQRSPNVQTLHEKESSFCPGFPAGRALGSTVPSGKAAGARGSVALPTALLPAGIQSGAWKLGPAPGRGGKRDFVDVINYYYYFGCAGSSLLRGVFSSCGKSGLLSWGARASHHAGFFCYRA